jgi:hypothetical protein
MLHPSHNATALGDADADADADVDAASPAVPLAVLVDKGRFHWNAATIFTYREGLEKRGRRLFDLANREVASACKVSLRYARQEVERALRGPPAAREGVRSCSGGWRRRRRRGRGRGWGRGRGRGGRRRHARGWKRPPVVRRPGWGMPLLLPV